MAYTDAAGVARASTRREALAAPVASSGTVLADLDREQQRDAFPRILRQLWAILGNGPHGNVSPETIGLDVDAFFECELIAPSEPETNIMRPPPERERCELSCETTPAAYPLLPPRYVAPHNGWLGGDLDKQLAWMWWVCDPALGGPVLGTHSFAFQPDRRALVRAFLAEARRPRPHGAVLTQEDFDRSPKAWTPARPDALALGVIYYTILTGAHPFPAYRDEPLWTLVTGPRDVTEEMRERIQQLMDRGVPDPREHTPAIDDREAKLALALLTLQAHSRERLMGLIAMTGKTRPTKAIKATPIEVAGAIPAAMLDEKRHLDQMPDGPVKDSLASKFRNRLVAGFDYFDGSGTPVIVSSRTSASYTFSGEQWMEDGPSYSVRLEECDPLSEADFRRLYPIAASAPKPIEDDGYDDPPLPDELRTSIGAALIRIGLITDRQFETAWNEVTRTRTRLLPVLVRLGFVGEAELQGSIARAYQLETVDLRERELAPEQAAMLPADLALKHHVVVIEHQEATTRQPETLSIAGDDPSGLGFLRQVIEERTACRVEARVATPSALEDALRRLYPDAVA